MHNILAVADSSVYAAGLITGRALFPTVGAVLLILGVRSRRRSAGAPALPGVPVRGRGLGLIIAGSVIGGIGLLGLLAVAAAASV